MATIHKFGGGIECVCDEPVDLDCGCTAYPGDDYAIYKIKLADKVITYSACDDCYLEDIFDILMKEGIITYEDKHVKTAEEEYEEYQDYLADSYDRYED